MKTLVEISRYIGSRFDLVQAGGGNTSIKEGNYLHVKSSGTYVGDVSLESGITTLNLKVLKEEISKVLDSDVDNLSKKELELRGSKILAKAHMTGERSSIETFIHACFGKYVVHTHPISVTHALSTELLRRVKSEFSQAYISEYKTPGIELLIGMKDAIAKPNGDPTIIFLENHGLIVSSDCPDKVIKYTNEVCDRISNWTKLDFSLYKESGDIFNKIKSVCDENIIVQPITLDYKFHKLVKILPGKIKTFSPDIFIYLGFEILDVGLNFNTSFENYISKYGSLPNVIISKGNLYSISPTYKKSKEIEDILRCYLEIVYSGYNINSLNDEELKYLSGWEAEIYRKQN